jgi:hypothetical protein
MPGEATLRLSRPVRRFLRLSLLAGAAVSVLYAAMVLATVAGFINESHVSSADISR